MASKKNAVQDLVSLIKISGVSIVRGRKGAYGTARSVAMLQYSQIKSFH